MDVGFWFLSLDCDWDASGRLGFECSLEWIFDLSIHSHSADTLRLLFLYDPVVRTSRDVLYLQKLYPAIHLGLASS